MAAKQIAYEPLFRPLGIRTEAPRHLWRTGKGSHRTRQINGTSVTIDGGMMRTL